jgi:transcriptional regulator with XRE-family HTH domain
MRYKEDAPHAAFAKRLNQVFDESRLLPGFNQGRYTWIRDQLAMKYGVEVTRETVRKWVSGETVPRNEKLRALAKLFDVDEGWLAFGVRSDVDLRQQPDRILADSGAVSLVAGLIQMAGGTCALPEPGDNKNEFVDLYAIIGRRQRMIAVRLGDEVATGKYRFSVPNEFEQCVNVGVVRTDFACFDLLLLSHTQIKSYGDRRGPHVDVTATKREKGWMIGRSPVLKITDFNADLSREG